MRKFGLKLASLLLVVAMLMTVLPLSAFAAEEDYSKSWIDGTNTSLDGWFSSSWDSTNGYVSHDGVDSNIWKLCEWKTYYENFNATVANDSNHANNMAFLNYDNKNFRNFEIELGIQSQQYRLATVMVAMRQKTPGQPVSSINGWDFGKQPDGSESLVMRYFANENTARVYSGGTALFTSAAGTVTSNGSWNWLKIRVVEDTITLYALLNGNYTELGTGTIPATCTEKGYISIGFANCKGSVRNIKLTSLDANGNPTDYPVDSTRKWFKFAGNTSTDGIISTYWDAASGYTKSVGFDLNNWQESWGYYENKNATYTNTWENGGFTDNMAFLAIDDDSFRNFELDVRVNALTPQSTVMIAMREKTPGQPVPQIGSNIFGKQPDSSNSLLLRYFTNENSFGVYCGGNQIIETSEGVITGKSAWNWFKIRVVGNTITVSLCDASTGVYTEVATTEFGSYCEESGYISVGFGNCKGAIYGITATKLNEEGKPTDYDAEKHVYINSLADFAKIGTEYPLNRKYFLNSDITITENDTWTSVPEFEGTFNGQGHKITGLTNAMFAAFNADATVKNLIIDTPNIPNESYSGCIVKRVNAGNASLENIAVSNATIRSYCAGGFVGKVNDDASATISNCSIVSDFVSATLFGGFIGGGNGTKVIKNSSAIEYISWCEDYNKYSMDKAATVENVYTQVGGGVNLETARVDKTLKALGFSDEYWVHDGKLPQLKITGAENYRVGDANLDKTVDLKDLVGMKKYIAQISSNNFSVVASNMDGVVTADGTAVVNATDLTIFRKNLLGGNTNNYKTYDVNLTGAKALYLGDSIAHGANDTVTGAAVANTPNDVPSNLAWCGRVSKEYGMTGTNVAMSGWALASGHGMKRIVDEFNMVEDVSAYDYVILHGGVNDVWHSKHTADSGCAVALGAITAEGTTEFDNTTLYGALEEYVTTAISLAPNAKIGYIINPDISSTINAPAEKNVISYADMVTAIKAVCDKYKISYLDFSSDEEFINKFEKSLHLVDGVHPNSAGYDVIADYVGEWMTTL